MVYSDGMRAAAEVHKHSSHHDKDSIEFDDKIKVKVRETDDGKKVKIRVEHDDIKISLRLRRQVKD